jgi:hypothetical protein
MSSREGESRGGEEQYLTYEDENEDGRWTLISVVNALKD